MTAVQRQAKALGDATRYSIFEYLIEAGRPVDVAELTAQFGLNHNAIRQHLAKLLAAGLLTEATAPAEGRGRPRLLFEPTDAAFVHWSGIGPYERLSRMLLEVLTTGDAPREVGRRFAHELRGARPSSVDSAEGLQRALARQGFEPQRLVRGAEGPEGAVFELGLCPFESAAAADPHVVCALHLGLVEGFVDGAEDAQPVHITLTAADPHLAGCRVSMRPAERDGAELVVSRIP